MFALGLPGVPLFNAPAHAQCAPEPAGADEDVTCATDDDDGYTIPKDLLIGDFVVEQGVTITDTNPNTGALNQLRAVIYNDNRQTFSVAGGVASFLNKGTIEATLLGRRGVMLDSVQGDFINEGTIIGRDNGVELGAFRPSQNVGFSAAKVFHNSGTIVGGSDNASSGARNGVRFNGYVETFINDGRISGLNNGVSGRTNDIRDDNGVRFEDDIGIAIGSFINTGIIESTSPGGTGFPNQGDGIFTQGGVGYLHNSGTISSIVRTGINVRGNLVELINDVDGVIKGGVEGVYGGYGIEKLTNYGVIEAVVDGVDSDRHITTLINYGTITGGDEGVDSNGIVGNLTNYGSIYGADDGLSAEGNVEKLINYGRFVSGDTVIKTDEAIVSLTNAGLIATEGDASTTYALREDAVSYVDGLAPAADYDTTLTLNVGSVVIGRVELGPGTNTLNIGPGLSLDATFDSQFGKSALVKVGETNGAVVAIFDGSESWIDVGEVDDPDDDEEVNVLTRRIVTVDQGVYNTLGDTVTGVLTGLYGVLNAGSGRFFFNPETGFSRTNEALDESLAPSPSAFWATGFGGLRDADPEAVFAGSDEASMEPLPSSPSTFWVNGFGGFGTNDPDTGAPDVEHHHYGIVGGTEIGDFANFRVELFGGVSYSEADAEFDASKTDTITLFAGANAKQSFDAFDLQLGFTTGVMLNDTERLIANNIVVDGAQTATAEYTSTFISPSVEVSTALANPLAGAGLFGWNMDATFEPSVTLRYTGVFAEGFTESDAVAPLTLDAWSHHLVSARGTIALPITRNFANGTTGTFTHTIGGEIEGYLGDDTITGTLLGQDISTNFGEDDVDVYGLYGIDYEHNFQNGLRAYARADARYALSGDSYDVRGQLGLRRSF